MIRLEVILTMVTLVAGQSPGGPLSAPRPEDSLETRRAVFERAQADFDAALALKNHASPEAQRLYRSALSGFESVINSGVHNGLLHYNVANTYLRLGEVGKAIVHYRRALRLMPGDGRIRKNLQFARNLCEVQIPQKATSALVETLLFWHFGTSKAARTDVALAAYVGFWLLMLLRLFLRRGPVVLVWATRATALLALVAGTSAVWDTVAASHRIEGVLVADEVTLRKGNGEYYDPQLDRPLSEGVEFRLIETREDVEGTVWYHIVLRDGKQGWLRSEQADLI